jgi:hypothetical protein
MLETTFSLFFQFCQSKISQKNLEVTRIFGAALFDFDANGSSARANLLDLCKRFCYFSFHWFLPEAV